MALNSYTPAQAIDYASTASGSVKPKAAIDYANPDRRTTIDNLYQELLGRQADKAGMDHWDQSKLDAKGIRDWIMRSDEYKSRNGGGGGDSVFQSSPLYQQWVRRQALEESNITGARDSAIAGLNQQMATRRGTYDLERRQGANRINKDFESRGMFRSSGRHRQIGEVNTEVGLRQNQFESGINQQIMDERRKAAGEIARTRSDLAERRLQAANEASRQSAGF